MTTSTKKQPPITLTKGQKTDYDKLGDNKSAKIRYLASQGYKQAQIARKVGVIQQFVSNVLSNQRIKDQNK